MKKYLCSFFLLAIIIWAISARAQSGPFVTKWYFPLAKPAIEINTATAGVVNYSWVSTSGKSGSGSFTASTKITIGIPGIIDGDTVTLSMEPVNLRNIRLGYSAVAGGILSTAENLVDVKSWGTAPWSSMQETFRDCSKLKAITATDSPRLEGVGFMSLMFYNAILFNSDISGWNTSKVTNMTNMFCGAKAFNQDISSWNTSNVKNISYMFFGASSFNKNIGNWNTDSVQDMSGVFYNAVAFNQNISGWNTSNTTKMDNMFLGALAFNQKLGSWNLAKLTSASGMFNGSGLNCENYSCTLAGWANSANTNQGVNFNTQNDKKYSQTAIVFRNKLINEKGWKIDGDKLAAINDACYSMALAVNFSKVTALLKNDNLQVGWTASSESNNDYYVVEASANGKDFTPISDKIFTKVKDGTSATAQEYSISIRLQALPILAFMALVLSPCFKRRYRTIALMLVTIGLGLFVFSCQKNAQEPIKNESQQLLIRIKQVDKDGGASYSKAVRVLEA